MSAYLFDEALVDKFREVTGDDRIHIISPDTALAFLAQKSKDEVKFPAIILTRGTITITDTLNQYAMFKGQTVRINEDNTATKIKLVPIRIEWTVNVCAVDRYTCDEIVRELIFYIMTHPRFQVQVPYGADVPQNFDVFLDPEIVDNSDLAQFSNLGDYFRESFSIYTDNAHFYSSGKQYLTKSRSEVFTEDHLLNRK